MALKAGRVGVHPSQVDNSGHIIGGESVDAYTKSQADAKFVNKSQLKANNKNFNFAYDETSGKYGYKLGADGEFIPFSSGVSGTGIFVANPSVEGISILQNSCEIVEGGIEKVGSTRYVNFTVKMKGTFSSGSNLITLPYGGTVANNVNTDIIFNANDVRANRTLNTDEVINISTIIVNV